MRMILLAGAVLALTACGGNNNQANDSNAMAADNMALDSNLSMNGADVMDANAAANASAAATGAGANGSVDANTAAAMAKDANTHDPDTNLANGM